MPLKHVIIEKQDRIATVWLNRPAVLNALDGEYRDDIVAAFSELREDVSIRVIIVAGKGRG